MKYSWIAGCNCPNCTDIRTRALLEYANGVWAGVCAGWENYLEGHMAAEQGENAQAAWWTGERLANLATIEYHLEMD